VDLQPTGYGPARDTPRSQEADGSWFFERKTGTEAKLRWKFARPQGLTMGSRRACQQGGHSKGWSTESRTVTDWVDVPQGVPQGDGRLAASDPQGRPAKSGLAADWLRSRKGYAKVVGVDDSRLFERKADTAAELTVKSRQAVRTGVGKPQDLPTRR